MRSPITEVAQSFMIAFPDMWSWTRCLRGVTALSTTGQRSDQWLPALADLERMDS